jgi:hypothetical protein
MAARPTWSVAGRMALLRPRDDTGERAEATRDGPSDFRCRGADPLSACRGSIRVTKDTREHAKSRRRQVRGVGVLSCVVPIAWTAMTGGCAGTTPTHGGDQAAGGTRAATGGTSAVTHGGVNGGGAPASCPPALPHNGDTCPPGAGGCTYLPHRCICSGASTWLCQQIGTGGVSGAGGSAATGGTNAAMCKVGGSCAPGSYCTGQDGTCSCVNGAWGLCQPAATGGNGSGGVGTTGCALNAPCAINYATCIDSFGDTCTCMFGSYTYCTPPPATGGTASTGGRAATGGRPSGGRSPTGGAPTGGKAAVGGRSGAGGTTGGKGTAGNPVATGGSGGDSVGGISAGGSTTGGSTTGGSTTGGVATGGVAPGGTNGGGAPAICEPDARCFDLQYCPPPGGGVCYCSGGALECVGGQGGAGGAGGLGAGAANAGAGGAPADCGFGLLCDGTFTTCSAGGAICLCLGGSYVLCG